MRLIGQNLLCCNVKGCRSSEHSLSLVVERSEVREKTYSQDAVVRVLKYLHWDSLSSLINQLGEPLPQTLTEEHLANEQFLQRLHRLLFEFEVLEGKLVCTNCKRVYPIINGIPNLNLFDAEI